MDPVLHHWREVLDLGLPWQQLGQEEHIFSGVRDLHPDQQTSISFTGLRSKEKKIHGRLLPRVPNGKKKLIIIK